jgi:2,3-bisphosphoglycerate-dependent phosphoglycerate mutase
MNEAVHKKQRKLYLGDNFKYIHMRLVIFLLLIFFWSCAQEEYTTTVYLVRHAEKDLSDTSSNPPLSRDGFVRAQTIKEKLASERIEAIFTTYYRRNMQTMQPLAEHKNLEMRSYEAHEWQPMVEFIKENLKGLKVVICGHSNNLLPMIQGFGGNPPIDSISENEYNKMFKVIIKPDETLVEMVEY